MSRHVKSRSSLCILPFTEYNPDLPGIQHRSTSVALSNCRSFGKINNFIIISTERKYKNKYFRVKIISKICVALQEIISMLIAAIAVIIQKIGSRLFSVQRTRNGPRWVDSQIFDDKMTPMKERKADLKIG
jgi:hypothetical protein